MSNPAVQTALDAPDISLNDFRAMREGRTVETENPPSEAPPAETPADAESGAGSDPAEQQPEESQGSDEDKDQQQERKPKKGIVDEVIKLRREVRELKGRAAPPPPQEQPKPAGTPGEAAPAADEAEPDISKYTDYDKYNRDLVRFEIRRSQREAAETAKRIAEQNAQQERMYSWQQRIDAARVEFPDFESVALDTALPVTRTMGDAIMASELGARVLYHLGTHPSEAARISKLEPVSQIRELTKLEMTLAPKPAAEKTSDEDDEEPPPPNRQAISKAPAPIPRPAGNSGPARTSARSLEGMSQREYRELRESGKLR